MKVRPNDVRGFIEQRLTEVLEWYKGCDAVEETLASIRLDVQSVLNEARAKFRLNQELPFLVEAKFDEDGYIVVRAVSRSVS